MKLLPMNPLPPVTSILCSFLLPMKISSMRRSSYFESIRLHEFLKAVLPFGQLYLERLLNLFLAKHGILRSFCRRRIFFRCAGIYCAIMCDASEFLSIFINLFCKGKPVCFTDVRTVVDSIGNCAVLSEQTVCIR